MKYIPYGKDKLAIVDDADYELLSQFTWHDCQGYPQTSLKVGEQFKKRRMHQLIVPAPAGLVTDHINRIKHDNRRINLRHVDHSGNNLNRDLLRNNTSGITGLSWHSDYKHWTVQVRVRRKNYYVGCYKDKEVAIKALIDFRDKLANDPESIPDKGLLQRNNTTGVSGVYFVKARNKWKTHVTHKGTRYHIGTFKTREEAIAKQSEFKRTL